MGIMGVMGESPTHGEWVENDISVVVVTLRERREERPTPLIPLPIFFVAKKKGEERREGLQSRSASHCRAIISFHPLAAGGGIDDGVISMDATIHRVEGMKIAASHIFASKERNGSNGNYGKNLREGSALHSI